MSNLIWLLVGVGVGALGMLILEHGWGWAVGWINTLKSKV